MNTLIIYDDNGMILSTQSGEPAPQEPVGVPFLWVDIPEGQRLKMTDGIGVDTSVSPHQPILEDIPLSAQEQRISDLEATVATLMMTEGGSA